LGCSAKRLRGQTAVATRKTADIGSSVGVVVAVAEGAVVVSARSEGESRDNCGAGGGGGSKKEGLLAQLWRALQWLGGC
jgi:hypothetical protein